MSEATREAAEAAIDVLLQERLKDVAEGHELGDTTTLRDPAVVEDLKRQTDAVLRPGG
jgi:hypothetical protein